MKSVLFVLLSEPVSRSRYISAGAAFIMGQEPGRCDPI